MLALSSLEAAVDGVKDGSIEFQLLKLVLDHSDRFFILSEKISRKGSEKSTLKQSLSQRYMELTAFEEERQKVSSFIRMCVAIKQGNVILKIYSVGGLVYFHCDLVGGSRPSFISLAMNTRYL